MNNSNDGFQQSWKSFENLLNDRLAFIKNNPNWIDSYMKDIMDKAMSTVNTFNSSPTSAPSTTSNSNSNTNTNSNSNYDIFETHAAIIARVKLPEGSDPYPIRTYWRPNRLRIEGLPQQKQLLIPLPSTSSYNGCKAKFIDGVLEVRMPKDKIKMKEREIYIQYD